MSKTGRILLIILGSALFVLAVGYGRHKIQYVRMGRQYVRMRRMEKRVAEREAAGQNTTCSREILTESHWLLGSQHDAGRTRRRLDDLERLLAHPEEEAKAEQQDPADGGWGQCHEEWFFKVNATYDHLSKPSNRNEQPRYAIHLFDRVNSPEKLTSYFTSIATSKAGGPDHRRELNESLSNLMRLILHDKPSYYTWDPGVKDTLLDLILHRLRDPQTGWWGERYIRDGQVKYVDDLSVTFHVVSYLHGNVSQLGDVAEHLMAVKDQEYSRGWLENGHYANHHNMDVVTLFRFAWPAMSEAQKQAAAVEMHKMLDWCLTKSLHADGSFPPEPGSSDSLEEANSWGVSFLARIGYFDPAKRFWTTEQFPNSETLRQKLIANIQQHLGSGGAGGGYYEDDLGELQGK